MSENKLLFQVSEEGFLRAYVPFEAPEALATAAEERTAVASQIQSRITGGLCSTALTCSSSSSANVDLY